MKLVPRNWRDFQHYKDRNPPWIRLHRSLLDNKDFQRLPVESRALAPMLWLLASESVDGVIDATTDDLAFRLRQPEQTIAEALHPLIKAGFFSLEQPDSTMLATCVQVAVPETEAEAERETEASAETEAEAEPFARPAAQAIAPTKPRRSVSSKAESPTAETWTAYSSAYEDRYGATPVRNATVNGQLAQVVGRLGAVEAPQVAAFYVVHKHRLYVAAMHPVNLLLRDCEKLRTEWATGRQVTSTQANQADRTQTNFNAFAPLIAKAQTETAHGEC